MNVNKINSKFIDYIVFNISISLKKIIDHTLYLGFRLGKISYKWQLNFEIIQTS